LIYESLFQCTYPVHSEPVVFKSHPTIPQIEASKCGVVRCKSEEDRIDYYSKKGIPHLVWECWTGEELKPFTNIRYKNLNFYDTSFENLEILVVDDKGRQDKERQFLINTVDQMLLREEIFGDRRDMVDYFTELGVPQRFIKAWQKVSPQHKAKLFEKALI
jgi:hypothetical protein